METINDIVRKVAEEMLNTSMQDITAEVIYGWATRLGDAATCKDSLQVGNAAAMREALELMNDLYDKEAICTSYANTPEEMEQIDELYRKTKAALSAPPRNCDRLATFADAIEAWRELDPREAGVFDEWLFAEAKGATDEQ